MKQNIFTKSRKAEVPIVILVLGVLLLLVLTFVNIQFFSSNGKKYGNLGEVIYMEKCLEYIEQYSFYVNMHYSLDQIKQLPNLKNLIISENQKNFLICNSEGLKVKYDLDRIKN